MITHCALFWGGDIIKAYKSVQNGRHDDRHHAHMVKHYKDAPWWWYITVLVISFILGLVVVIKENLTLPPWAYVVSLLIGIFMAPIVSSGTRLERIYRERVANVVSQSTLLLARYGNGVATNNLAKMLAGLMVPERPVGNMYFAAWSHNVISNTVNLCQDLKMGEYRM